ncbi:MAG: hypothetical protein VCA35_15890, partial [Roseibacillus sp.]
TRTVSRTNLNEIEESGVSIRLKRAVVGGRVARIYELVERHESSGEGHARVVHQEQLGSIEAEV